MHILLFDPICFGFSHSAINASLLSVFSLQENIKALTILLEKDQSEHPYIENLIKKQQTAIKLVQLPKIENHAFAQLERNFILVRILVREVLSKEPDIVCFLASDNLFSPLSLGLLSMIVKKPKLRFIFIFHNNIENTKNSYIKKALWNFILKKVKVYLIVLSPFLEKITKAYFPTASVCCIGHPTFMSIRDSPKEPLSFEKKRYDFLFLGRHAREIKMKRNLLKHFLKVCSEFDSKKKIYVAVADNIDLNKLQQKNNVEVISFRRPINDKQYDKLLRDTRFIVITQESANRLTASGVLADAITFGVPVIAPSIGHFNDSIPYVCRNLLYKKGNLINAIRDALNIKPEDYHKMVLELFAVREKMSDKNTAKRLAKLMEEIEFS